MKNLNTDIFYETIGHINQRDRQTILLNLSLVSRPFFQIVRPLLFEDIKWPHTDKRDETRPMFLPETLWGYFKTFHLDWHEEWSRGDIALWVSKSDDPLRHLDELETALPFMTNLRTFQITCPFDPPLSLFRVLRGCTSITDLRITDTPIWNALKAPDAPILFTAERITFSIGEAMRVGEGPYDAELNKFSSYQKAEYRIRYESLIRQRQSTENFPPGWPFLQRCRVETITYLQLSGDYYSLADFNVPHLSFPVLETLILTGLCPSRAPHSVMTLPGVVSLMPKLRDLRVFTPGLSGVHRLSMVPRDSGDLVAVYGQLMSLAMSNYVLNIPTVLRYANRLERLTITAVRYYPRSPEALRMHQINSVLDNIGEGGGGHYLKQLRIISRDCFDVAFVTKLGEVCPCLEVIELELCGYNSHGNDDTQLWDAFTDAFSRYHHLAELRIGLLFPVCDHDSKPHCKQCISNRRHRCAMHFAQRLPNIRRIGLEYQTRRKKYEDRWMDFDIIRGLHGGLKIQELPVTWYPFPEVWKYVPLVEDT